jgi:hypothetical protein
MHKRIYTSGYFSLKGVNDIFHNDEGFTLCTTYDTNYENQEKVMFNEVIDLESEESKIREEFTYCLLNNIQVGCRILAGHNYTSNFMMNWIMQSFFKGKLICEAFDKCLPVDAVVVHNDHDPLYGALASYAMSKGIPAFCLYNGFSSCLTPMVNGMHDYRFGNYYCVNGEMVLDYIQKRVAGNFKGVLTGCASWDHYYKKEANREPNTYLYNPTTNYDIITLNEVQYAVATALHPWTWMLRPVGCDDMFYRAFARFQKTNPDAKLIISARPYSFSGSAQGHLAEIAGVENPVIYTNEEKPFRDLVQECEFFISGISSTIQEAIITRTPTLFLCGKELGDDNFFKGRDCYIESIIHELAIQRGLETLTEKKAELIEACDAKAYYYNYMDDGKASERSVGYILTVIEG